LPHPDGYWEYDDLVTLRERVNGFGLELMAIENTPWEMYEDCMVGGPDRDRQIENYCTTITNVGRAGIDNLGFCWMPNSVWSSSFATPGRGGVEVRSFDYRDFTTAPLSHGRVFDEDEVWSHFEYFITRVIGAAEAAGVRLAIHPDDPPVPSLGGIARIFRGIDGFRRATEEICPSPNLGLNFCMGTWSEMGPGIALEAMQYFAERDRLVYVHFRDVKGHLPTFDECFLGEGNIDPVEALLILKRAGYDGFVEEDHVPVMLGDENMWAPRGRAYTTGYIQGLIRAVDQLA
jgi:mannonate dehydratase